MRIGIDARLAHIRREGGIAQYTLNLIQALARLEADDYLILHHRNASPAPWLTAIPLPVTAHADWPRSADDGRRGSPLQPRRLFTPPHHRLEQWALPAELWFMGLDVLHSPDFIPPFRRRWASVITVHDLAFCRYPHLLTRESAAYYGQVRRAVASAERVIAVSEATRRDIVNLLDGDEERIAVIYEAADPLCRPLDDPLAIQQVLAQHGLSQPFALFVGTIEPRKNISLLIRAFQRLSRRGVKAQLVIAGRRGWLADEVFALAGQLGLGDQVKFIGALSRPELVGLYNAARLLVLPSLYEGFGLTALEAMACGTPVVVSNVSSLPEVVGDAGLTVDPQDEAGLAEAMRRLLEDDALRDSLREAGLQRAQRFSWERAARETLDVYHQAAAR
ncbi:MAG: glycosyltransferase family 4 protein [Chloroflexi bacterium]|nr:glycosyltransferase family 4 protein [Chloroflexota bacterium]